MALSRERDRGKRRKRNTGREAAWGISVIAKMSGAKNVYLTAASPFHVTPKRNQPNELLGKLLAVLLRVVWSDSR